MIPFRESRQLEREVLGNSFRPECRHWCEGKIKAHFNVEQQLSATKGAPPEDKQNNRKTKPTTLGLETCKPTAKVQLKASPAPLRRFWLVTKQMNQPSDAGDLQLTPDKEELMRIGDRCASSTQTPRSPAPSAGKHDWCTTNVLTRRLWSYASSENGPASQWLRIPRDIPGSRWFSTFNELFFVSLSTFHENLIFC